MSIQDDIFDVQDALKRKPHRAAAFERILTHLYAVETQEEDATRKLTRIAAGVRTLRELVIE